MTLLLRDPDTKDAEKAAAEGPQAQPDVRLCPTCQAPLEPEQDWCLACGQAQPGRLGGRPGMRAAATVVALTTVLVGGAVAASYAALRKGDNPPAVTSQVAQAPQPQVAPPAPSVAAPTAPSAVTPAPPVASAPVTPPASPAPSTPPPSVSKPVTPAPSSSTHTISPSSRSTKTSSGTQAHTRTTTVAPPLAAPSPIKLQDTDVALYDPYSRATGSGDPAKAVDGDPNTSFPVVGPDGSQEIGAGMVIDLGKLRGLRQVDLTTKTPGFKIEIYASDSADLPPDVLDTRWAHLRDVKSVDAGKTTVSLGGGTTKYRHLLLWFTTPPTDGTTVRISELKLYG